MEKFTYKGKKEVDALSNYSPYKINVLEINKTPYDIFNLCHVTKLNTKTW